MPEAERNRKSIGAPAKSGVPFVGVVQDKAEMGRIAAKLLIEKTYGAPALPKSRARARRITQAAVTARGIRALWRSCRRVHTDGLLGKEAIRGAHKCSAGHSSTKIRRSPMRLYEFEGKSLLESAGIAVPKGAVIDSPSKVSETPARSSPTVVKAQVLWGKRSKAGGILSCADEKAAAEAVSKELGLKIHGEVVKRVLVEERLDTARECYIGVTYRDRAPCVIACSEGGVDIEEVRNIHPERVVVQPASVVRGLSKQMATDILTRAGFGEDVDAVAPILLKVYDFFISNDAILVEINPLIKTKDGKWYAADAKIEIDDEAAYRSRIPLPERLGSGKEPTRLEVMARENDLLDSRGAAGRMFYEIEGGNIIIIAAGGGTSMEALDDLYSLGGRPAVFTEHSGNPTGEKVAGLVKIALMYPGEIDAIWVIGGRANFTDIYETLVNGVLAGIRETPNFDKSIPIIVRRAGPRDEEAYAALRKAREEEGYNIFLRGMATSIADSARMVMYQANKHYMARKRAEQL